MIQAALAGLGLGLAYEEQVAGHIAERRLVRVLEDWTPPIPGFFLYYPSESISQPHCLRSSTRCEVSEGWRWRMVRRVGLPFKPGSFQSTGCFVREFRAAGPTGR